MTLKSKILLVSAAAVALSACAQNTRSLGDLGDVPTTPALYKIERDVRDGVLVIGPDKPQVTPRKRVAVVVGNEAYTSISPLDNPANDAKAMARLLRKNGFRVLEGTDLTKRGFERILQDAVVAGGPGAEIVVFYAGHGFQVGSKNYIVPVDAKIAKPDDLPFQTVRLNSLFRILNDRSRRNIAFLDACRNNPFAGQPVKAGVSNATSTPALGFSEPRVPSNGFVAYATSPGSVAYDGEGANSPFTTALLSTVNAQPASVLSRTLSTVRDSVKRSTGGEQVPTWTSRLKNEFAFAAPPMAVAEISPNEAAGSMVVALAAPTSPAPSAGSKVLVQTASLKPAQTTPQPSAPSKVAPTSAAAPAIKPKITIEVPKEQVVALGGRIAEELALPPSAKISIPETPAAGVVAAVTETGDLTPSNALPVLQASLGALVYEPPITQTPVEGPYTNAVTQQSFLAKVSTPTAEVPVEVTVQIKPDACDVAAGDWLDLQGVGVCPGRALPANIAISACTASVAREPENGRFHYQLGRAYAAAGRDGDALGSYKSAAQFGHVRARVAMGRVAEEDNDLAAARQQYSLAADQGDPFGIEALGKLGLKTAATPGEREAAYEQLSVAIDLGLPGAMQALADYYSDPASPDYDPARSEIFASNAASRRPRCVGISTTAAADFNIPTREDSPGNDSSEPAEPAEPPAPAEPVDLGEPTGDEGEGRGGGIDQT